MDHEIDGLAINPQNPNIMFLVTPDSQYGRGIYRVQMKVLPGLVLKTIAIAPALAAMLK